MFFTLSDPTEPPPGKFYIYYIPVFKPCHAVLYIVSLCFGAPDMHVHVCVCVCVYVRLWCITVYMCVRTGGLYHSKWTVQSVRIKKQKKQHHKYKIQNTKYKIQNTKYKIQNTKSNTKYKIQIQNTNTKYKIQNTKTNTKYKIQNTKYKIQNGASVLTRRIHYIDSKCNRINTCYNVT